MMMAESYPALAGLYRGSAESMMDRMLTTADVAAQALSRGDDPATVAAFMVTHLRETVSREQKLLAEFLAGRLPT